MIYRMPKFEYLAPMSLVEALSLLSQHKGQAKVMAGGTDLLINMKQRAVNTAYLISLAGISDLDYIRQTADGGLCIGALATHQSVVEAKLVSGGYQMLATACGKMGTPQVRNMGTIAGNLCNAGPSADSAPPLLALDTRVKLASTRGEREVALDSFFTGPFQTVIADDELLTEIILPPLPPLTGGSYQWQTKVTAVDETLVGVAALVVLDEKGSIVRNAHIALGSVAPTPMRAKKAEEALNGQEVRNGLVEEVAMIVAKETQPRSRAKYRRSLSGVLAKRAIKQAIERARS